MPIYKIDKKKDGLQCYRVQVNRNDNGRYRQIVRTAYGYDAAKRIEKEQIAAEKDVVCRLTLKLYRAKR